MKNISNNAVKINFGTHAGETDLDVAWNINHWSFRLMIITSIFLWIYIIGKDTGYHAETYISAPSAPILISIVLMLGSRALWLTSMLIETFLRYILLGSSDINRLKIVVPIISIASWKLKKQTKRVTKYCEKCLEELHNNETSADCYSTKDTLSYQIEEAAKEAGIITESNYDPYSTRHASWEK